MINQVGEEPRHDEASCRNSISRAAANLGTCARSMRVFVSRQITLDVPNTELAETNRGKGEQEFNLGQDQMKGICE